MALFDFLKKKKVLKKDLVKPEAVSEQEENPANAAAWESADAIRIGSYHTSGPGIHIMCEVKYIPSSRTALCKTTATSDVAARYEALVLPPEIADADGMIAFITVKRPWLGFGYRLDDELRNRINEAFRNEKGRLHSKENGQIQCPKDKHNFVQLNTDTGEHKYKCKICGLKVQASLPSGGFFREYFGSYIDGVAHKWNPLDMRAEDIKRFTISFGDLPIVTVKYDGAVMKVKNSINGSRDGWRSFPQGYFDEKRIILSKEEKRQLNECLLSLDFSSFTTSKDFFQDFLAPGFCSSDSFYCYFSNGKGFACFSPQCEGFYALAEVVKRMVGLQPEPLRSDALCDNQETGWFCKVCGSFHTLDCRFCKKCGNKRPW